MRRKCISKSFSGRLAVNLLRLKMQDGSAFVAKTYDTDRFFRLFWGTKSTIAGSLDISITDYGSSLVSCCHATSCIAFHESTCGLPNWSASRTFALCIRSESSFVS